MQTQQQPFTHPSPTRSRHRRGTAILVAGLLMTVFAPSAFAQNPVGFLFLLDPTNGLIQTGNIDRNGVFTKIDSDTSQTWTRGVTNVVTTSNGILAYNTATGEGQVVQMRQNGTLVEGTHYTTFAKGWTHIISNGDFLFFYRGTGIYANPREGEAAIGYISPEGTFVQTAYFVPGSFASWTHVVATDNYLFFYNSFTGAAAVGYISYRGQFFTTQSLQVGPSFSHILSDGHSLVLYQNTTGTGWVGTIDPPGQFTVTQHSVPLSAGYTLLVRNDHYLVFHNPNTTNTVVGYIDRTGYQFRVTDQTTFAAGFTQIASTKDDLLLYTPTLNNGYEVVEHIDRDGKLQATYGSTIGASWKFIVATAR